MTAGIKKKKRSFVAELDTSVPFMYLRINWFFSKYISPIVWVSENKHFFEILVWPISTERPVANNSNISD